MECCGALRRRDERTGEVTRAESGRLHHKDGIVADGELVPESVQISLHLPEGVSFERILADDADGIARGAGAVGVDPGVAEFGRDESGERDGDDGIFDEGKAAIIRGGHLLAGGEGEQQAECSAGEPMS